MTYWAVELLSEFRAKKGASTALGAYRRQPGFLGGRLLMPSCDGDSTRVQAFFRDEPESDDRLPEGMRRVVVPEALRGLLDMPAEPKPKPKPLEPAPLTPEERAWEEEQARIDAEPEPSLPLDFKSKLLPGFPDKEAPEIPDLPDHLKGDVTAPECKPEPNVTAPECKSPQCDVEEVGPMVMDDFQEALTQAGDHNNYPAERLPRWFCWLLIVLFGGIVINSILTVIG